MIIHRAYRAIPCLYLSYLATPRSNALDHANDSGRRRVRDTQPLPRRKPEHPPAQQTSISPTRADMLPLSKLCSVRRVFPSPSLAYHGTYTHHPTVQMRLPAQFMAAATHARITGKAKAPPLPTFRFHDSRNFKKRHVSCYKYTQKRRKHTTSTKTKTANHLAHKPGRQLRIRLHLRESHCEKNFNKRELTHDNVHLPPSPPSPPGRYLNVEACWALFSTSSALYYYGGKDTQIWLAREGGG